VKFLEKNLKFILIQLFMKTLTDKIKSDATVRVQKLNSDLFIQRLKLAIGSESQRSFAHKINVAEGTLRAWLSGKAQPSMEAIISIAAYKNVSTDWLLMGFEVFREDVEENICDETVDTEQVYENSKNYSLIAPINKSRIGDPDSDFVLINYYDVEVSAGAGSFVEHENRAGQFAFTRDWLKSKGLIADKCALIKARGDSMEPTIHDGDIMLVDTSIHAILDDSIYVIQLDNRAMVKRIQQNLDGSLVIISDNDLYDKQLITPEQAKDVKIAGRVTWYAHDI